MRMKMVGVKEIFIKENKMCILFFRDFIKWIKIMKFLLSDLIA